MEVKIERDEKGNERKNRKQREKQPITSPRKSSIDTSREEDPLTETSAQPEIC